MNESIDPGRIRFAMFVGLLGWVIPGAGYLLVGEKARAIVIFAAIVSVFCLGLYIGSIGAVDPVQERLWYVAQMMTSPAVAAIGCVTAAGAYPVYGRPAEVGQIYTGVAGLLNLLCVINAMYWAYAGKPAPEGE